jgi:hypothetical protein
VSNHRPYRDPRRRLSFVPTADCACRRANGLSRPAGTSASEVLSDVSRLRLDGPEAAARSVGQVRLKFSTCRFDKFKSVALNQFHATGDKQLRLVVIQCAEQLGCDKIEPELRISHQCQNGVRRRTVLSTRADADTLAAAASRPREAGRGTHASRAIV